MCDVVLAYGVTESGEIALDFPLDVPVVEGDADEAGVDHCAEDQDDDEVVLWNHDAP